MKKVLFILLIMVLLWFTAGLQAVPQDDGRSRSAEKLDAIENEIRIVLDRVSPSLVKVIAENGRKYVATGIALEGGLVVTSMQVTRRPFERLSVETVKGKSIAARVAGQDPRSGLALLRLDKKELPSLPPAQRAEVGNWVALVGLFYDHFPAIFQGIISSRSDNELILNAPVAPGSVGGAVVNKKGELLGIIRGSIGFSISPDYTFRDHSASIMISGSRSESGSLCYAIPAGQVQRIVERLKVAGKVIPGWLGISFSGGSNRVYEVLKGSPAEAVGIARGDRIEEIAGKRIASFRDIAAALEFSLAGDRIGLALVRAGKPLHLDVQLGERHSDEPQIAAPEPPEPPESPDDDLPHLIKELVEIPELAILNGTLPGVRNYVIDFSGSRQLGIEVMEITVDLGQKFAVKEGYGLLISRISEGSPARKAGLKAGDIIVRANQSPLRRAVDLRMAMDTLKDKEAVLLELYRDGQTRKFSLVPDKSEKRSWNIRRFSQKMENLKDSISDEAKLMYQDEINKLLHSKEKALDELQKEKRQSLKKIQEESQKLVLELKRLQQEKDKLADKARNKYAKELKRIMEELRAIRERIRSESEKGSEERDDGR